MGFPRFPMSQRGRARMFKPGLTSASMVLRYSIEYIIEWAYELTDALWMDGWMERWRALRQKQRVEMTTGILELRFCIASLT